MPEYSTADQLRSQALQVEQKREYQISDLAQTCNVNDSAAEWALSQAEVFGRTVEKQKGKDPDREFQKWLESQGLDLAKRVLKKMGVKDRAGQKKLLQQAWSMAKRGGRRSVEELASVIKFERESPEALSEEPESSEIKFGQLPEGYSITEITEQDLTNSTRKLEGLVDYLLKQNLSLEQLFSRKGGILFSAFEGFPLDQVSVENRPTCILATLQMLISHARWIGRTQAANFDLVHQKGEIMKAAGQISSNLISPERIGTLEMIRVGEINDLLNVIHKGTTNLRSIDVSENSVQYLQAADFEAFLKDAGLLELIGEQEKIVPEMPGLYLVADMIKRFMRGEKVSYGVDFSAGKTAQERSIGHEVAISGMAVINKEGSRESYFHIIDPLGGTYWLGLPSLLKRIGAGGFLSKAEGQISPQSAVEEEITGKKSQRKSKEKIKWG